MQPLVGDQPGLSCIHTQAGGGAGGSHHLLRPIGTQMRDHLAFAFSMGVTGPPILVCCLRRNHYVHFARRWFSAKVTHGELNVPVWGRLRRVTMMGAGTCLSWPPPPSHFHYQRSGAMAPVPPPSWAGWHSAGWHWHTRGQPKESVCTRTHPSL